MKQPNTLLRISAVASSILLVSGFLLYRAGALDRLLASDAVPAAAVAGPDAGSTAAVADTPEVQQQAGTRQLPSDTSRRSRGAAGTLPSSNASRQARISDSARTSLPETSATRERPIMSGSKSMAPLIIPRDSDSPDSATRAKAERERIIMSSSKSMAPLISPPTSGSKPADTSKPSKHTP